ncbi:MAG: hypothetical protein AAF184_23265 [Pseudomonadota bacterium]
MAWRATTSGNPVIHPIYLPYAAEQLSRHFVGDSARHIEHFERSAERYEQFMAAHRDATDVALSVARRPRQIEQDERVWSVAALKHVFDHPQRNERLIDLFSSCFGRQPPIRDLPTWVSCLDGPLELFFQVQYPSPPAYLDWLAEHLEQRHLIPFVLDAARRPSRRPLEGPVTVDAVLLNPSNGFAVLFEAQVLDDCLSDVPYDSLRNQLTRTIDIMVEPARDDLGGALERRSPDRTLFCMLTPQLFRDHPESRHYAALLIDYMGCNDTLVRDLPHRDEDLLQGVSSRLGWLTFEDLLRSFPGACPWMTTT